MGRIPNYRFSRRDWLKLASAGVVTYSMSGWIEALAADAAKHPQRRKSCILLWMNGGPSQTDTFDLKPGHENGGEFHEIATSVPGIRISEHLPKIAKHMDDMAIIRSMSTKEGDHGQASFLMRTGYLPRGPIQYPSIGALVAKELGTDDAALPHFVSIAPYRFFNTGAYGPGFLGPKYAPLIVADTGIQFQQRGMGYEQALKVQDLRPPKEVSKEQADARIELLEGLEQDFVANHPGVAPLSHKTAYARAVKLMRTAASKVFNLEEEPATLRDAYGRNLFGQGCLLARRLVELGVPFVEVSLGGVDNNAAFGWDTHAQNFDIVKQLSQVLDPAWGTLMSDLKARGLLDSTLIVWMGEFGRTPKINGSKGRDHFPNAWSTVLAGGGIKGGRVIGKTSEDGTTVEERKVLVPDFLATICKVLGMNTEKKNLSNVGRPIRIVDKDAEPIKEVLS
jgi:hypothetical protein